MFWGANGRKSPNRHPRQLRRPHPHRALAGQQPGDQRGQQLPRHRPAQLCPQWRLRYRCLRVWRRTDHHQHHPTLVWPEQRAGRDANGAGRGFYRQHNRTLERGQPRHHLREPVCGNGRSPRRRSRYPGQLRHHRLRPRPQPGERSGHLHRRNPAGRDVFAGGSTAVI